MSKFKRRPKSTATSVTPVYFRLDTRLREGLDAVQARDGVGLSEQLNRAVRLWLDTKGVKLQKAS